MYGFRLLFGHSQKKKKRLLSGPFALWCGIFYFFWVIWCGIWTLTVWVYAWLSKNGYETRICDLLKHIRLKISGFKLQLDQPWWLEFWWSYLNLVSNFLTWNQVINLELHSYYTNGLLDWNVLVIYPHILYQTWCNEEDFFLSVMIDKHKLENWSS